MSLAHMGKTAHIQTIPQTTITLQRNGTHGATRKCVARFTHAERNVCGLDELWFGVQGDVDWHLITGIQ
jgi:hypothetical protein